MSNNLANARKWCEGLARSSDPIASIAWLTVICKNIISHLEESESAKPVTEHLIGARKSVTAASQAYDASGAVAWLTDACMQIISHLEAQEGDDRLSQGVYSKLSDPVTDPKLQKLLDQTQFRDLLTITHRRGKHLANISGPVLSDQTHDPCVGIDLLDGEPYIVRNEAGIVWAPIAYATLCRDGELVAMWAEDADH